MVERSDGEQFSRVRAFEEYFILLIGAFNSWRLAWRLLLSVTIVLAALLIRITLLGALGHSFVFVTFFPAVIIAALIGRFGGGMLAIVLSVVLADWLIAPLRDGAEWNRVAAFVVGNCVVVGMAELLYRARNRVNALEASRENERLQQRFIEQTPAAIALFDLDMRYLAVSSRWLREYRLTGNLIGRSHYEVFPEITEEWKSIHRRALAGEILRSDDDKFVRFDGSVEYRAWEVRPWRRASGKIGGIVIFSEDISERKRATNKLIEGAERLKAVLDTATEAIVVINGAGVVQSVNSATVTLFGYAAAELVGQNVKVLMPPDFAAAHDGLLDAYERTGVRTMIGAGREVTGRRKNGSTFPVDLAVAEWRDASGERFFTGIMRDITERKRAEEALRERDAHLRQAAELARLTYYELDFVNDRIRLADNYSDVMGFRVPVSATGEASHTSVLSLVRKHVVSADLARFDADFTKPNGLAFRKTEYRFLGDDRVERWIEGSWSLEYDSNGAPLRGFGTNVDITERKRSAEEFARIGRLEVVGQVAGGIAHDFNNLLAVIAGNLELAAPKIRDERVRRAVFKALIAVESGANLNQRIRRLLSLAHGRQLQPQLLAVGDHIQATAELLKHALGRNIELTTSFAEPLWPTFVDPGEIDSAMFNLTINARDAMDGRGHLDIRGRNVTLDVNAAAVEPDARVGEYIEISVNDDGSGMPAEVLQHARQPFFTTKGANKGTGLGLSSVAEFMRQLGGFMTMSSTVGKGTTVSLYLPRAADADGDEVRVASYETLAMGDGELILVVEDDERLREVTLQRIESLGYAVIEASHAVEAIERLNSDKPIVLVFSDIVMPGRMNGYDLAKWVTTAKPDVKVVLCSGYNSGDDRRRGPPLAEVITLDKPYTMTQLSNAIRAALSAEPAQPNSTSPVNT